jgi:hypothetical protein
VSAVSFLRRLVDRFNGDRPDLPVAMTNNDHSMIIQRDIFMLYPPKLQRMSQIRYERHLFFGG